MPKINGKVLQAEYDECITDSTAEDDCCYCLTNGQVKAMLSFVEYFRWSARWYSKSGAAIDDQKVVDFADDLARRLMMGSCGETQVIETQINEDTWLSEISTDGGVTWQPNPDDPRNSYPEPIPPVTSGAVATKCDAAANAVGAMRQQVNRTIDEKANAHTWATFLLIFAAIVLGLFVGVTWALIPALLEPLLQIIWGWEGARMASAMSNTTYNELLCVFYCHISENGAFTEGNYKAVLDDCATATKITNADARHLLHGWIKTWGQKGLNLATSSGTSIGADCSACECPCYDNFHHVVGDTVDPYYEGYISIQSVLTPDIGNQIIIHTADKSVCCNVLDVKFDLAGDTGGGFTPFSILKWDCDVDWDTPNSAGPLTGSCVSQIIARVHPVLNPDDVFVMSILFDACT